MYSNLHFEYCDTKYKQRNQKAGTNAEMFNQVLSEKYGALRFTVLSIHTTPQHFGTQTYSQCFHR